MPLARPLEDRSRPGTVCKAAKANSHSRLTGRPQTRTEEARGRRALALRMSEGDMPASVTEATVFCFLPITEFFTRQTHDDPFSRDRQGKLR